MQSYVLVCIPVASLDDLLHAFDSAKSSFSVKGDSDSVAYFALECQRTILHYRKKHKAI